MRIFRWLPIILWVIVICYLSFSSLEKVPVPKLIGIDKIGHFILYFILELTFLIPLERKVKEIKIATLIAIVFSASTELIQHYFVENRTGEIPDFVANLIGISIGFLWLRKRKFAWRRVK